MLTRTDIERLLGELADELAARGITADLFLVGGGAMVLAYDRGRSTRDLAAVFEPKTAVYDAARSIASRHDLPDDWLNDAVKDFLPGEDPAATVFLDRPALRVRVASPVYLFAMKAMAARAERDADDLLVLYGLCGFASVDEALDAVEATLGPLPLTPKTAYLLRELLEDGRRHEDDAPLPTYGAPGGRILIDLDDRDAVWAALDSTADG